MADKKISQLTAASTPLAGTEVLPIVQGGSTVKVSVANLTAGRTVDATTVNATTVDATNVEVTNIKAKDGTASIAIADSTGVASLSANPILSGGTANGVLYLNASKVATSGSGFVFDGTNVGIGTSSPSLFYPGGNNLVVGTGTGTNGATIYSGNASEGFLLFADSASSADRYRGIVAYDHGANAMYFSTNAAERLRVSSAGLVGINTGSATPSGRLEVMDTNKDASSGEFTAVISSSSSQALGAGGSLSFNGVYTGTSQTNFSGIKGAKENNTDNNTAGYLSFHTRPNGGAMTERARVTSGGSWLVNRTTALDFGQIGLDFDGINANGIAINDTASANGSGLIRFLTGGTVRGSITNDNNTGVLYNQTSDERLKKNIANADDFGDVIDAIQVRKFDWKENDSHTRAGFVAQELVTVAPEAVYKPSKEEDMMGVDYSKLVPMLVKEVQSLRKRVAELEAK